MKVALGIVKKEDKFLLIERLKQERNLLWAFPGGKKEIYDSNLKGTVIREVFEETGIICKPVQLIGRKKNPVNINYFLCDYVLGELVSNVNEIKQCGLYSSKEIYSLVTSEIFPPVKQYLDQF